jgi:hypothetical protein
MRNSLNNKVVAPLSAEASESIPVVATNFPEFSTILRVEYWHGADEKNTQKRTEEVQPPYEAIY